MCMYLNPIIFFFLVRNTHDLSLWFVLFGFFFFGGLLLPCLFLSRFLVFSPKNQVLYDHTLLKVLIYLTVNALRKRFEAILYMSTHVS